MTWGDKFVSASAPLELGVLLEQLQLVAVEVLGRGANTSLDGPMQANALWTGRVQTSAQQIRACGDTPLAAARELAREVLNDPRSDGAESRELRRLLTEDGQ